MNRTNGCADKESVKRTAALRGLLGFPLGIAIGFCISIGVSLAQGQGAFLPCAPQLTETMGSEIGAVLFQTFLSGLLGSAFSAESVIWEIEEWSVARQSGAYFLIASLVMLPAAYLAGWMEHSLRGFLSYFAVFIAVFLVFWIGGYLAWRRRIGDVNRGLKEKE